MKRIRDISIGFLICFVLMTATTVLADDIVQQINVIFDNVQVEVNGEKLDSPTILYNGTTYLPMRTLAEAIGKDVTWNQETKTANIVEKKASDNVADEFTIVQEKNGIPIIAEKNKETYYTINYTLELMQEYGEYTFDNKSGNISFVLFEDGTIVVENIPYTIDHDIIFISKTYYENTILPLISK